MSGGIGPLAKLLGVSRLRSTAGWTAAPEDVYEACVRIVRLHEPQR